jgi:hypothetical protein
MGVVRAQAGGGGAGGASRAVLLLGDSCRAELDLLVVRGGRRLGFEFERSESPQRTRSMHAARTTLGLDSLNVVHAVEHSFPLGDGIQATSISRVFEEIGAAG